VNNARQTGGVMSPDRVTDRSLGLGMVDKGDGDVHIENAALK
jgi:hypothetical protein